MHYANFLLVFLLYIPSLVSAKSTEEKYKEAFNQLNFETGECLKIKRKTIPKFNDWFYQLSDEQKGSVAFYLSETAMNLCLQEHHQEYSLAIIDYAATASDTSILLDWVKLRKGDLERFERISKRVEHLDDSELRVLLDGIREPFDPLKVIGE